MAEHNDNTTRDEAEFRERAERAETTRAVSIRASTWDEEDYSVEIEFAAGATVLKYDWRTDETYLEALPLDRLDLSELNTGSHVLKAHSRELDDVIGSVVPGTGRIEGDKAVARIRLSREPVDAPTVNKIKDKIIRKWSFGYDRLGDITLSRDEATGLQVRMWDRYLANEVSPVPVPADGFTDTRAKPEAGKAQEEETMSDKPKTDDTRSDPVVDTAAVDTARDEGVRAGIEAEATRQSEIRATAGKLGHPAEEVDAMLADGKMTLDEARSKMIDARAERDKATNTQTDASHKGAEAGEDEGDKVRSSVRDALIHRANPGTELPDASREFRYRSITEVAAMFVRRAGGKPDGFAPSDVLTAAMNMGGPCRIHSTSDFPLLLADVASKELLNGYSVEKLNFLPISTRRDFANFKPNYEISVGGFSSLATAPEGSTLTYGTMDEDGYNWSLVSYRKGFNFTRQMMLNDDLGALTEMQRKMGAAAMRTELNVWWAVITANLMADGATDFLSAGHANVTASAGAVPSVAQIAKGKKLLRKQTDVGGTGVLDLMPQYIVGPTDIEGGLDQLLSDQLRPAESDDVVPTDVRGLKKIIEPRLDANSTKFWYLVADPSDWISMRHGYLQGASGPRFFSRESWDVQGIDMKIEHDFAAAAVDHRAWYRNKGEA